MRIFEIRVLIFFWNLQEFLVSKEDRFEAIYIALKRSESFAAEGVILRVLYYIIVRFPCIQGFSIKQYFGCLYSFLYLFQESTCLILLNFRGML